MHIKTVIAMGFSTNYFRRPRMLYHQPTTSS